MPTRNINTDLKINGSIELDGILYDAGASAGTSGQVLSSTSTGTDWVTLSEISGVDGTGTANYLSKWLDANTITNSLVYDNGTNVGIGITSPTAKLHVVGDVRAENSRFLAGRGTASAPAYRFHDDGDTGMFNIASNILAFATSGTEVMRLAASGDVIMGNTVANIASNFTNQKGFGYKFSTGQTEIATTADIAALTLGRNLGSDGAILDLRKEGTVIGSFGSNTTGGQPLLDISASSSNGNMRFLTSGAERMRINSSGNITLGTASVAAANAAADDLHLKSSGSNGITISSGNAQTGTIFFGDAASSAAAGFRYNHNTGDMAISAEDNITFACDNVGIGITNPAAVLSVRNPTAGAPTLSLQHSTGSSVFEFQNGIANVTGNALLIKDTTSNYDYLTLRGGNVGIGTTNPTARITLADHTTAAGGIKFRTAASSVSLWSSGSGNLNTDNSFNVGSRLRLVGGNAVADPDIGFTGATAGTGFSRAGQDITFVSGGAEQMRLDNDGNLGVGTANPNRLLQINGEHGTTRMRLFYAGTQNDRNAYIDMWASEPGVTYNGSGIGNNINGSPYYGRYVTELGQSYIRFVNGQLQLWTGPASAGTASSALQRLTILDGGNVGIGTGSPNYPLEVKSASPFVATNSTGTGNSGFAMLVNAGSNGVGVIATDNGGSLTFDNGATGAAQSEKMRITSAGNVGIGETAPEVKLEVAGDIMAKDSFVSAGATASQGYTFHDFGTGWGYKGVQSPSRLAMFTASAERVTIDSDGNVGIGTTSPDTKLQVAGTIKASTHSDAIVIGSPTTVKWKMGVYGGNDLFFRDPNNNTRLAIDSAGTVIVGAIAPRSSSVPTKFSVQAGMSEFETTLTNNNDWENSAISILERGNVGSAQSADKYSPNLNFHWSARVSNSLWMNSSGHLNWGSFGSTGIPNAIGVFQTNTINLIGTGRITGVDTVSSGTDATSKTYVDNAISSGVGSYLPLAGGTLTGDLNLTYAYPRINLTDTNHNSDYSIINNDGTFSIYDITNNSHRLSISAAGNATFAGDVTVSGGGITLGGTGRIQGIDTVSASTDAANKAYVDAQVGASDTLQEVTDNGNTTTNSIGIGTTNPSAKLQIGDGTSDNLLFYSQGQYSTTKFYGVSDQTGSGVWEFKNTGTWNQTRFYIEDANNSSSRLTLDVKGNAGAIDILAATSHGNVGIGTDAPDAKLQIKGIGTGSNAALRVSNASGSQLLLVREDGIVQVTNGYFYASHSSGAYFDGNLRARGGISNDQGALAITGDVNFDSNTMFVDSTNNRIGIGTGSPLGLLMLRKDQTAPTRLIISNGGTANASTSARLSFYEGVAEKNYIERRRDGTGDFAFVSPADDNPFVFENASGEFMTLVNSKVGIGTPSPATKLHVYNSAGGDATDKAGMLSEAVMKLQPHASNSTNMLFAQVNGGSGIGIQVTNGPATANWDIALSPFGGNVGIGITAPSSKLTVEGAIGIKRLGVAAITTLEQNGSGLILNAPAGYHPFIIKYNGVEQVRFANTGNVGIGTTNPAYKLDVAGNARIGSSSQTTTSLYLTATNTAGSPATAVETIMQGYEGRGMGTFYTDNSYSGEEWFNGINYAGGFHRWSVGYDESGGQAEYVANAKFTVFHDGRVGIGTDAPFTNLEVAGSGLDSIIRLYAGGGTANIRTWEMRAVGVAGEGLLFRQVNDANNSYTNRMIIDTNGDVGIGTINPAARLDVKAGHIRLDAGYSLQWDNSHERIEQSDGHLEFFINNGESMTLDTNGLGIGTTSPAYKLDVSGAVRLSSDLYFSGTTANIQIGSSWGNAVLNFKNGVTTFLTFDVPNSRIVNNIGKYLTSSSNTAQFGTLDNQSVAIVANNSEKMSILANGNVGIGTTNPTEKLHIRQAQSTSAAVNPFIKLQPTSTTNDTGLTSIFLGTTTASSAYGISLSGWRASDGRRFAIKTHSGTNNGTDRLVIINNGYVGIGTTNPSSKLQVVGTITATTKNFLIDDPKTEGQLQYSVIESNEHGVCVRGESDQEEIELPEEWEWLVHEDSVTVQLTSIDQVQHLFVLERNNIRVRVGGLATNGQYSYVVYGTRKDVDPLEVNIS